MMGQTLEEAISMLKRLRHNPLFFLFLENKRKNFPLAAINFLFNLIAAFLEGASFTLIWLSFIYLSGDKPAFLPSWLELRLAQSSQVQLFSFTLLGAVLAQILRSAFTYLGQMVIIFLTINLQTLAQEKTYLQIFRFSFASVSRYKTGDLIHYATAPPTYFRNVMEWINRVIVSLMMILAYVIFMAKISLPLTCCTLAFFGISAFLQRTLIKKIVNSSQEQTNHLVELNKETAQQISGLRTVHLYNQQKYLLNKIGMTLSEIAASSMRLNKWLQLILPVNEVIAVVLVGVSMSVGLILLKGSSHQVFPLLLTFLALTYRLGTRLQITMSGFGEIAFNMGPIERLEEILSDQEKEFLDMSEKPSVQFHKKIEFNHVSFLYPGKELHAIQEVSFSLEKGKTIAFVGSSGGGKSTLVDLLLRLYEPTEGEILIDGNPLSKFSLASWRGLFGVVSQDVFLFHETIESNIRFGKPDATHEEIRAAAEMAEAHKFIASLPEGYQTVVGEKGHKLSGGERQRISLARALVRRPEILVLDEATSNLDSQSEKMIQKALENLRGKMTMLVVAHRLATIHRADQILMLDRGKIIEQGTHENLIRLGGRYHHFWNLQTQNVKTGAVIGESSLAVSAHLT